VAPRHLLDTRLNPPADLVRRAGVPLTAASVAASRTRTIKVTLAEAAQQGDRQGSARVAGVAFGPPAQDDRSAIVAASGLIAGSAVSSAE
jgi:hypothetical protein